MIIDREILQNLESNKIHVVTLTRPFPHGTIKSDLDMLAAGHVHALFDTTGDKRHWCLCAIGRSGSLVRWPLLVAEMVDAGLLVLEDDLEIASFPKLLALVLDSPDLSDKYVTAEIAASSNPSQELLERLAAVRKRRADLGYPYPQVPETIPTTQAHVDALLAVACTAKRIVSDEAAMDGWLAVDAYTKRLKALQKVVRDLEAVLPAGTLEQALAKSAPKM